LHVRKEGCALIKRIMLLLTVVLVMAAMMVASAMPAFAQGKGPGGCPAPGTAVKDTSPQEFGQGVEGAVPIAFGTVNGQPFPTAVADICTDALLGGP
jgi:hypothetical protein